MLTAYLHKKIWVSQAQRPPHTLTVYVVLDRLEEIIELYM